MGKFKTLPLLICAALATTAFAAPAIASADEWYENGVAIARDKTVTLDGSSQLVSFDVRGVAGTYNCAVTGKAAFSASSGGAGEITEYDYDLRTCRGTGVLQDCVAESIDPSTPWSLQADSDAGTIAVSNIGASMTFDGNCAFGELEVYDGTASIPLHDRARRMVNWPSSGTGTVGIAGQVIDTRISGTVGLTPASVYGVQPPIEWTKNGSPITSTELVDFSAYINFRYTFGTFTCPNEGTLELYPASEGGDGWIYDLEVSNPNECYGTGLFRGCQLDYSYYGGNWEVVPADNRYEFVIYGMGTGYGFDEGCAVPYWSEIGDITVSVDDPEAISRLTKFTGSTFSQPYGYQSDAYYMSSGSLSPGGVYGIEQ